MKTLKDLNLGWEGYKPEDERIRKEIKLEGIKWIKHWISIDSHCPMCDVWNEKRQEDMKHFLNITEEDLL